jgi:hypothetical protein
MDAKSRPDPAGAEAAERLQQLVRRAEQGDQSVLPELRAVLDRDPGLWRFAGDLARLAEDSMIALAAGHNLLLKESLSRKVAELKAELAGPTPSLLDRLLAERVAICWLMASYSDTAYAQAKGTPAPAIEHAWRRQDSAGKRYAEAIKLLATVRRLLGSERGQREDEPDRPRG